MKKTVFFLFLALIYLTGCGEKSAPLDVTVSRQNEIILELKGAQTPEAVQAFSDLTNGGIAVIDVLLNLDSPDYLISFFTEQEGEIARFNLYVKENQLYFTPSLANDTVIYRSELTATAFEELLQKSRTS